MREPTVILKKSIYKIWDYYVLFTMGNTFSDLLSLMMVRFIINNELQTRFFKLMVIRNKVKLITGVLPAKVISFTHTNTRYVIASFTALTN